VERANMDKDDDANTWAEKRAAIRSALARCRGAE
jgi:hypothetical protein